MIESKQILKRLSNYCVAKLKRSEFRHWQFISQPTVEAQFCISLSTQRVFNSMLVLLNVRQKLAGLVTFC
jgi:hypothetical protein